MKKARLSHVSQSAAAFAICAFAALSFAPRPAVADGFSDMSLTYKYGSNFAEPAVVGPVSKNIIEFTYVNGGKFGGNFLNLDILQSNGNDPLANGAQNYGSGATEEYAVFRHEFSLSNLLKQKIDFGPVRDIGITAGFDLNAKNTQFAPRTEKILYGAQVDFKIPHYGYAAIDAFVYSENNHNGFGNPYYYTTMTPAGPTQVQGLSVHFKTTYQLAYDFGVPFKLGLPALFTGFGAYTGTKGNAPGYFNSTVQEYTSTVPEFLSETALMWDVGSLFGKGGKVFAGVGYQYWHNKFGNSPIQNGVKQPGTQASLPMFEATVHL